MTLRITWHDLKHPFLIILLIGITAILCLPVMPIDETRYLTVAWEMRTSHSWLVPLLNGIPYSHKPPLFFWIIQAMWKCFGVHDTTPRLISTFASLVDILLTYKISLNLWPNDRKSASYAGLILGSTGIWLLWSGTIMLDILLTAWILMAIRGIQRLTEKTLRGWLLLTLGILGGLLTKGPIVFVYTIPISLLGRFWITHMPARWHLKTGSAFLAATGIALLWAVPAAITGGENYSHAIFWEQSAGRIANSFAHCRPFWWYLPLIPIIFFPWSLFLFSIKKNRNTPTEKSLPLATAWIVIPFIILSLISGKQVHYLIPLLPAGALLAGHATAHTVAFRANRIKWIGLAYLLFGLTAIALPFIPLGADVGRLRPESILSIAAGLTVSGTFLLLANFRSVSSSMKAIAISTALILSLSLFSEKRTITECYDIKRMANFIKEQTDGGQTVVHVGKYHGQYQFLGRLTTPLPVLDGGWSALDNFIVENPNVILISYQHNEEHLTNAVVLCTQKFRGKTVTAWRPAPLPDRKEAHENPAD